MKDKKISTDLLFLISTTLWLSTVNFKSMTKLQLIATVISSIALVLLIVKLFVKGE